MLTVMPQHAPLRGESGFTMIEVLVATATSVVVLLAAGAVFIVSLHQSSRITDRVHATQLGRIAMSRMIDELHSACLTTGFAPIQEESTTNRLFFINTFGEEAIPKKAYEREIEWTGNPSTTKSSKGELIEKTWPSTSASTWPTFAFNVKTETPTTKVLGTEIYNSEVKPGAFLPIFEYSKYAEKVTESTSTASNSLTEIPLAAETKLGEKAGEAAAVKVNFTAAPTDNNENVSADRSLPLSTQVVLSFGSPAAEGTIKDSPCQ
jgi:Tfp pilus assembly protein PilW